MEKKLFVLDTSVILYDHSAIKNFDEHDVAIPIQVLEEIDNFKKGNETRNFEAREFIRFVDHISKSQLIHDWIPIAGNDKGNFKVVLQKDKAEVDAEEIFGDGKYDHKILNTALWLQKQYTNKKVILVSKDICLRLKAKALQLLSEDYETGKIKDVQHLYTGSEVIEDFSADVIDEIFDKGFIEKEQVDKTLIDNNFLILKNHSKSALAHYNPYNKRIENVTQHKAFGIKPRNAEQIFAMHALLNPAIQLVTIQGLAGTGKTLIALACALEQRRNFRQIFITRPVIPLGNKDIGYLPGDIKSKLDPYMEPLYDNLKFIKSQFKPQDKNHKKIDEMLEAEKIAISPLAYIRGRSLANVFFIIDEAQNLTPHEVKTIISRAGDNTKIVFTGDIMQIDTPYLDAESNGLSYLIDKLKNNPLFAHITLTKGERSELANLATELL